MMLASTLDKGVPLFTLGGLVAHDLNLSIRPVESTPRSCCMAMLYFPPGSAYNSVVAGAVSVPAIVSMILLQRSCQRSTWTGSVKVRASLLPLLKKLLSLSSVKRF